ncbi:hypothetical protein K0M31_018898 [Melipona bicolor]|uniref:Uncharacterized protein n=1 Tax=Melipona bicolor TaxID=60889 RepID=A0AA40G4R2_9HYME|nr:hypothetical protein K0M31_018898 [Melipona bicolor]
MDVRGSWRIEAKRACLDCRENLSSRIPSPPPPPPPPPPQPVDRAAEKRGASSIARDEGRTDRRYEQSRAGFRERRAAS